MIVDAAIYKEGRRQPGPFVLDGAREACYDHDTFSWIGLYEPTEEEFGAVRKEFDLHELAVEDAIHAHQRPKLELYDDTLFVVLKPARYVDQVEVIELGEILCFVDDDFIVVVRHRPASALVEVRRRLEATPEELKYGPSAVLHAIIDQVIDDYATVLDALEGDIREVEEAVFSATLSVPTERIYNLKREVLQFHQATQPFIEPLERLARGRFEAIHPDLREFFRNTHDHLLRVVDRIGGYRDLLTSILEANLTQVSVRQNADMRKISAWVAIAAVPTMLAGIWGMNFQFMPEIGQRWSYPAALGLMVVACLTLYRKFKRSGWL
jgi:magnesium transporter